MKNRIEMSLCICQNVSMVYYKRECSEPKTDRVSQEYLTFHVSLAWDHQAESLRECDHQKTCQRLNVILFYQDYCKMFYRCAQRYYVPLLQRNIYVNFAFIKYMLLSYYTMNMRYYYYTLNILNKLSLMMRIKWFVKTHIHRSEFSIN